MAAKAWGSAGVDKKAQARALTDAVAPGAFDVGGRKLAKEPLAQTRRRRQLK